MTTPEAAIMIAAVALGTMLTRFLPFMIFPKGKPVPAYIKYLGTVLPYAVIGLLVVYCLKDVSVTAYPHALPELISVAVVVAMHLLFKKTLLSIAAGTIIYMILTQMLF